MKYFIFLLFVVILFSCDDPVTEKQAIIQFRVDESIAAQVDFPSTIINETNVKLLTINNVGQGKMKITSVNFVTGSDIADFDISEMANVLPISIPAGDSASFSIIFKPSHKGGHFAGVNFEGNFDDSKLILNGAENQPVIAAIPESISFDGATGTQVRSLIIENTGNAFLTLQHTNSSLKPIFLSMGTEGFTLTDELLPNNGTLICPKEAKDETCNGIPKQITVSVNYTPQNQNADEGNIVVMSDDPLTAIKFIPLSGKMRACSLQIAPVSDDTLDFGERFNQSANGFPKQVSVTNKGSEPCTVGNVYLSAETDSTIFWMTDATVPIPTFPTTLGRFESFSFLVMFKPTAVQAYGGELIIEADDPMWDDGKKTINLIGSGVAYTAPIANCGQAYYEVEPAIDNPSNPVSVINLDGSASYDPSGSTLTFKWEKISGPQGSVAQPRNPTQSRTTYFVDLSGEHKLKLTVKNEIGLEDSCEVTAMGITGNALHVELFWNISGDIDLHFKKPGVGDEGWGTASDCFFANCVTSALNWFPTETAANPKLDRDDISARGPENMNIDNPKAQNGAYYVVGAKNYSNSGRPTATVRIYCNGGLQFEQSQSLPNTKDFWYTANVEWTTTLGCNIQPLGTVRNFSGTTW